MHNSTAPPFSFTVGIDPRKHRASAAMGTFLCRLSD